MPLAARPAAIRRRISVSTCTRPSGRVRPLIRRVAPIGDSRIVPAYLGTSSSSGAKVSSSDDGEADRVEDLDHALDVLVGDPVEVDGRRRVGPGQVGRDPDLAVGDRVDRAPDVADDRPSQADLLDRALDAREADHVALEVLALGEDQETHEVVEDDALAGQGQRREHEAEAREHRPQVEDPEHDDDRGHEHAEPEQLAEQVLDRLEAAVGLGLDGRVAVVDLRSA